jgi:alpha-N-arabinofuranosidase
MLDAVIAGVDAVVGPERKLPLSLDEWNMWVTLRDLLTTNARLCDAVFFGGCYNRMIERADRVRIAMTSHLVNCMAPIQTRGDRLFVTANYLVGQLYRRLAKANALPVTVESGRLQIPPFTDTAIPEGATDSVIGSVGSSTGKTTAMIDSSATRDESGTTVFVVNRSFDTAAELDVVGLPPGAHARFRFLTGTGPFAANDEDHPERLRLREIGFPVASTGTAGFLMPPATVGALVVDAS